MREIVLITKALAEENRLRILMATRHGELCVCQIHELLELAPSTVSKHLSILSIARLLDSRKEGKWVHYALPDEDASPAVRQAIDWVKASLANSIKIQRDDEKLQVILSISPEELCQRQAQGIKCCSSAPATPAAARWPKDGLAP